jgi:two-component system sensor histidine kinase CpxA
MDTLLGRAVAVRIIEICQELRTEVESGATTWDEALAEAKAAYDVEFHLFSVRDWTQVAGEPVTIPEAVKNEFRSQRPRETNAPAMRPRPGGRRGAGPPVDRIVLARTDDPTTYWFGMRLAMNSDDLETRGPGVLYARTSALFGTGVLIDVRPWMFLAAGILVGSALLWLPLVRDLTSSVKQMTNATEKIADGRFDIELDEHRRDELGRLGVAINRMSHRLSGFVDGQKRFMGDTAHELTAPLARMQLALGILEQRVGADSQPYVRGVHEELDLMTNLVNELMSLTKAGIAREAVKLSRVELRPLIEAIITRECPDSQKVDAKASEHPLSANRWRALKGQGK